MKLQTVFLYVYSIVLPLFVLLVPKGMLTVKVYKNCNNKSKIGFLAAMQCYVPFYNSYIIRRALYGRAPVIGILNAVIVFISGATIAVRFLFQGMLLLQLIFTILMLVVILVIYITEWVIHYDLCNLFGCGGFKWTILAPPLASYLIATRVDSYFKKHKDIIEGTFDGTAGV